MPRAKGGSGDVNALSATEVTWTIKQTLNESSINRINKRKVNVHHSKRKPDHTDELKWTEDKFVMQ